MSALLNLRYYRSDGMTQERDNIYFLPSGNGVCVEECPSETNYTKFICYDEVYPEIFNNETGEVHTDRDYSRSFSTPNPMLYPFACALKNGLKSGLAHPV